MRGPAEAQERRRKKRRTIENTVGRYGRRSPWIENFGGLETYYYERHRTITLWSTLSTGQSPRDHQTNRAEQTSQPMQVDQATHHPLKIRQASM